jgi:hypothetical protein
MKVILPIILALTLCGCTGFGGKRTILFRLAVPTVFNLELSTTIDGRYKDAPAPISTGGESDLVAAPLSTPIAEVGVPSEPSQPSAPETPAAKE